MVVRPERVSTPVPPAPQLDDEAGGAAATNNTPSTNLVASTPCLAATP